ncbi:hypothetical protein OC846_002425 [Tilletia horrida]|uniref:SWR1-complex protein 5 n=1 Tax=Tilletia horrida TaxID=155126 RepID=A0AAN6JSN6_9BASI|nr:hypothetical protein OC846_002425 [Tilletia horrida]
MGELTEPGSSPADEVAVSERLPTQPPLEQSMEDSRIGSTLPKANEQITASSDLAEPAPAPVEGSPNSEEGHQKRHASGATQKQANQTLSLEARPKSEPTASSSTSSSRSTLLGPPPKKRKSLLGAKAASAAGPPKKPKLNTLEKSKLDWEAWKQDGAAADERDEIEAQTKGGGLSRSGRMDGYLHRADFLDRVSERVEAAEDEVRRSARSRP